MKKFAYVDSSVLVTLAITASNSALDQIKGFDDVGTSEIAVVECQSGLSHQLGSQPAKLVEAEQNLNQILARLTLYAVQGTILGHARALVRQHRKALGLRTLDAIHVATANLVRQGLSSAGTLYYFTADAKQHAAFTAEGHVGELIS